MGTGARIVRRPFGELSDSRRVDEYTLDNGRGLSLTAITFGGIVTSIGVPDRDGRVGNVVLGFTELDDYVTRNPYFGAIVGRFANRIAHGRFMLDGAAYQLATNEGSNMLHGGRTGFGARLWSAVSDRVDGGCAVLELAHVSEDGEEGFPGRLDVAVGQVFTSSTVYRFGIAARALAKTAAPAGRASATPPGRPTKRRAPRRASSRQAG